MKCGPGYISILTGKHVIVLYRGHSAKTRVHGPEIGSLNGTLGTTFDFCFIMLNLSLKKLGRSSEPAKITECDK